MTRTDANVAATKYREPGWFTTQVFNRLVRRLTRMGLSVWGSRELRVRGRSSGLWRTTPVNLLVVDGERFLVAPRGVTQWVRNLRAAGNGELRLGRRVEPFEASELADPDKAAVLRPYLKRWKMEVGVFFDGVDGDATDAELVAAGANHPVFRIHGSDPDRPVTPAAAAG
ncbi:MAG: nitroreductase/quinone reductase family protein [Acidimicrobiales bacterium]